MCSHIHCCYPFLGPAQRREGQAVARPKIRGVPVGPKIRPSCGQTKKKEGSWPALARPKRNRQLGRGSTQGVMGPATPKGVGLGRTQRHLG